MNFSQYARLSFLVQGTVWLVMLIVGFATSPWPALESFLEGFIRFYYPTVIMIRSLGIFRGEQNLTLSILLGVPLGILIYSIAFGIVATYYNGLRRRGNKKKEG